MRTHNIGKAFNAIFFTLSFVSLVVGAFVIASLVMIARSRCSKCYKNFGIRRIKSFEVGRKKLDVTDFGTRYEVTYDNTYRCEFCGYTFQRKEREIEKL